MKSARLGYFLFPYNSPNDPTSPAMSTLKQCLHYDPDSPKCLKMHAGHCQFAFQLIVGTGFMQDLMLKLIYLISQLADLILKLLVFIASCLNFSHCK